MTDKKHWYDGIFYDKIIAPNQDRMFNQIKNMIKPNSNVLDIGCGTGRLSFQLSDHCNNVIGVDLSSKNIKVANTKKNNQYSNVNFIHADGNILKNIFNDKFDYAVITYVIHEMPEAERIKFLFEVKDVSNQIIIGDYLAPQRKTFWGLLNEIVEYLAGKDHYNNFKNFLSNGGIDFLIAEAGLQKIKEIKNKPQTSHIVLLK